MEGHFSKESIEASQMAIELAIDKGGRIFDQKLRRVLEQAKKQSLLTLESVVKNALPRIDVENYKILTDFEAKKISRDNMIARVVNIDKRARPQQLRVGIHSRRSSKHQHQILSLKTRSQTRNQSRSGCVALNPETKGSEGDTERSRMQEEYQKMRILVDRTEIEKKAAQQNKIKQDSEKAERLVKDRASLQKKKHPFTFDYEGKVMMMKKNKKYTEDSEQDNTFSRTNARLSTQTSRQQRNSFVVEKSINFGKTFTEKSVQNLQKVQLFSNNNCRQVSSIPLIQLVGGVKIQQPHTSALLQKPKPPRLFKDDFLQTIRTKRFKSYIKTDPSQDFRIQDISGMIGGLTKNTVETESSLQGQTISTFAEGRRKEKKKASYKKAPFHLFTSNKFYEQKKKTIPPFQNKIKVEDNMGSLLLD